MAAFSKMHSNSLPPILITTCITSSDPLAKLDDPSKRLFHVVEGIQKWLEIHPKASLVLCDGSNFDLMPLISLRFPKADIECLCHTNSSEKISLHGKGYGEGEIIKYALSHSVKLMASSIFIKCTGKLWVENFNDCLKEWNGIFMADAHFTKSFNPYLAKLDYIDTRFYITDKNFYLENLLNLYLETNYQKDCSLENIFLKKINAIKLKNFIFMSNPIICGVGGGSGTYYKNNKRKYYKKKIKKILLSRIQTTKNYFFKSEHLVKLIANPSSSARISA